MSLINDFLEKFLRVSSLINDPFRVAEASADDYIHYEPIVRNECLVLYKTGEKESETLKLDIVLQQDINLSTKKVFSLYRTADDVEAQIVFLQMCDKLPALVQSFPELGSCKTSLQAISTVIRQHPTWSAAHLAAHFGCLKIGSVETIKKSPVASKIDEMCSETLETPLHVAVKAEQLATVQALVEMDVRMDICTVEGDTVLHYAAKTTKEIIQALTLRPVMAIINIKNNQGYTALHIACMEDKPDCVMELLNAGADVNIVYDTNSEEICDVTDGEMPVRSVKDVLDSRPRQLHINDIKNGGTPLHWTKTRELMEALIEFGCNVDAKNFQGNTALHVMVQHSRLSCAVSLLSHFANVNAQGANGNTPLHFAVQNVDLTFVHLLVTFGADVNLVNEKGESARHIVSATRKANFGEVLYALHVVGAKRCPKGTYGCGEGCSATGQFNGIPPEKTIVSESSELFSELLESIMKAKNIKKDRKCECMSGSGDARQKCRVLSLDGGGIRGLVLIQLLNELERVVEVPVIQCFDWVVGTSTGGILALVLATGKSITETRCLYFQLKDKVFIGARPYDSEPLEAILKRELGHNTVMADIPFPRVMITATKADRKPAEMHCFRNYPSPLTLLGHEEADPLRENAPVPKPQEQLLWQAARATGAAPTYFRPTGQYIDGGLIANNPTLDAITEIHQCNQAQIAMGQEDQVFDISCLVSLGTGKCPVVPVDTIDVFRPDSFWGACRMAIGATALGQLLVDQATQTDGQVTTRSKSICDMLNIPYFRLNPQLSENVSMNETDNKILVKMLFEATAYMRSIRDKLEIIAELIRP